MRPLRSTLRLLAATLVLLSLGSCRAACTRAMQLYNARPLDDYTADLQEHAGTDLRLARCGMLGATRNGYCLLEGDPREIDTFVQSLPVEQKSAPYGEGVDSCAVVDGIGERTGEYEATLDEGVTRFVARSRELVYEKLPGNNDNVVFTHAYTAEDRRLLCVQYAFPYG